jgi:hypothetical protein
LAFTVKCIFVIDKKNLGGKLVVYQIGFSTDRDLSPDNMKAVSFSEFTSVEIIQNFEASNIKMSADNVLTIEGCIVPKRRLDLENEDNNSCGF